MVPIIFASRYSQSCRDPSHSESRIRREDNVQLLRLGHKKASQVPSGSAFATCLSFSSAEILTRIYCIQYVDF